MPGVNPIPTTLAATPWGRGEGVAAALEHLRMGPDPDATAVRVARVLAAAPTLAERSRDDPAVAAALVAVCGASRALAAIAAGHGDAALDPLGWTAVPRPVIDLSGDPARSLRRAVGLHVLGIAGLDLTGRITMPEVGAALSDLADVATGAALAAAGGHGLAVIALGKWGGRELNYASDIDLVFVHEDDATTAAGVAARFIDLMTNRTGDGIAFRVDADLRPEGAAGPLSRSLGSYVAYWRQWAQTWELQSLLKARAAAGDPELGQAFLDSAEPFVYPERLAPEAIREIRAMKARTEALVADDELKRGVGGIRDIEFAVQLLQLVHGRADPELRAAATLDALSRLGAGGYIGEEDAADLADAYRWLRDVEHRIQLHDLRQTHSVPSDPAGRTRLAKVLGYRDTPATGAVARFDADLADRRREVRTIHERLFYRPLLEAFASGDGRADRQLSALGFTDSAAARAAVTDLTTGLSRRSRLMQHLLPVMMGWLSESPDPDLGLAQLRLVVTGADDNAALVAALRDHPAAAERLCRLLGTARVAGRLVDRIPAALLRIGDDDLLRTAPSRQDLVVGAIDRVRIRAEHHARVAALHRFWSEHLLETIAADVAGLADEEVVGRRLSDSADALVAAALAAASDEVSAGGDPVPPMAVIALGRWGGQELTYAGDLDALVVHRPAGDGAEETAARVTELLVRSLASSILGVAPPPLDLDLRPEGTKGIISRSLPSYQAYWERWALTWEHQALLRARPAAGDPSLGAEFLTAATPFAYPEHLGEDRIREVRAMKVRIEQERIPIGEDPEFHVKLGRGALADVEWAVQLLQMQHGHERPGIRTPSTRHGIAALHAAGLLSAEDAAILERAHGFCARVRNRLFLRAGRSGDSLPTDAVEAAILARSLGYEVAPRTALREEYRQVTRRARRVVEREFYSRG